MLQKYLDRAHVEGYLTIADEARLRDEFRTIGCPVTELQCPRQSQGNPRVLRTDSVSTSNIHMEITCRPDTQGLRIGGLVGAEAPGEVYIHVEGDILSDRVDP